MILLLLGLFLFLMLVVVHELGHFFAARKGGVEVEEFGIGFPPKLYGRKFKKHKTIFSINLLPLGGFVRLKGEHDSDTSEGSLGAANFRTKASIMLAGVFMNLIVAWSILLFLSLIGLPKLPLPGNESQFSVPGDTKLVSNKLLITYVDKDSPAQLAGLLEKDRIKSIEVESSNKNYVIDSCSSSRMVYPEINCDANNDFLTSSIFKKITALNAGKTVKVTVEQSGVSKTSTMKLLSEEAVATSKNTSSPKGYIGLMLYDFEVTRSTWSAPIVASGLIFQYTELTIKGIGESIKSLLVGQVQKASENVSGPLGIYFVFKDGDILGASYTLMIVALLSLTLAIMNVLPIPALDGGRLFIVLLYKLIRRPLTQKTEERIHGTGFIVLLSVLMAITIVDIRRFF